MEQCQLFVNKFENRTLDSMNAINTLKQNNTKNFVRYIIDLHVFAWGQFENFSCSGGTNFKLLKHETLTHNFLSYLILSLLQSVYQALGI